MKRTHKGLMTANLFVGRYLLWETWGDGLVFALLSGLLCFIGFWIL